MAASVLTPFENSLVQCFGRDRLERIQAIHVGVAGAGGLGSNCAAHLVRCGFRRLTIADFDRVEPSNLNRQFFFNHQIGWPKVEMLKENLMAINPNLELTLLQAKIDGDNVQEIFHDCQVIVEAFDTVENKTMLIDTYVGSGKLLVTVSGIGGWGNSDAIRIQAVRPDFYLVGDGVNEVSAECPPVSPRVNIAAAKQADVVLSWVLGEETAEGIKE